MKATPSHNFPPAPSTKNTQDLFQSLRSSYPCFIYHDYQIKESKEDLSLRYHFEIEGLAHFYPSLVFPLHARDKRISLEHPMLKRLVFSLGMMELISYWKLTCAPCVRILCSRLNQEEQEFFKKVYWYGLGEFFYLNQITTTYESFLTFEVQTREKESFLKSLGCACCTHLPSPVEGSCLLPIGGGKDSLVSLELLKAQQGIKSLRPFAINPNETIKQDILASGLSLSQAYFVERKLDPQLLVLNAQGYLNGHTPFNAVLAMIASLAAYLCRDAYVVLSNEASANEASVHGTEINHQWSKSSAFEKAFQSYLKEQCGIHQYYFSLLRPLSEGSIAALFAKMPQYHLCFRSCNRGSKTNRWCTHCSKCLFIALLLAAHLPSATLEKIFGTDMWAGSEEEQEERLLDLEALLGCHVAKPFECVGTVDEVRLAFLQCLKQKEYSEKPLFQAFLRKHKPRVETWKQESLEEKVYALDQEALRNLPSLFQSIYTPLSAH